MQLLILSLLLGSAMAYDDGGGPSATELERAHSLLAGTWEVVSIVDDGETLGKDLIKAKLAENGCIRVANRAYEVINPETGEKRTSAFRLDPSKLPREIDVISRDDRLLKGIYKLDGDGWVVNIQQKVGEPRPDSFDAPAGSGRMLVRMKMTTAPTPSPTPVQVAPAQPAATVPATVVTEDRKPTESELKRIHDLFSGNWDILSITDDGDELGPELIRQRFAAQGRVQFGTRGMAIVNPRTEVRRITAYRIDPTKFPNQIDVTTQFDNVLKGIYKFEGEKLIICVARHEDGARPTRFEAPGGSDQAVYRLRLASPAPDPVPAPAPPPQPSAADQARRREETIRKMMVGSWTMSDPKGTLTTVFRSDGTFSATRVWSRSAKKLFGPASDTSDGGWSYADSWLTAFVSATTDRNLAGHQINGRVQSIGDASMVITDSFGTVKTFVKLR